MREVTVLCPDVSNSVVGRSMVLANIIDEVDGYKAQICGPKVRNRSIHPVFVDEHDYDTVYGFVNPLSPLTLGRIISKVDTDIIVCTKPRLYSFGVGLLMKILGEKVVILDIDDWEKGLFLQNFKSSPGSTLMKNLGDPNGYFTHLLVNRFIDRADAVTTVSTELQQRYFENATLIPHTRSADRFNPDKFNKERIKENYNISSKYVTAFFGSPGPHKGIKETAAAIEKSNYSEDITYLITSNEERLKKLQENHDIDIRSIEIFKFNKLPEMIAMTDFVILHQNLMPASQGQVPAKLIDALAMAKPIAITDVAGLPSLVEDAAVVIPPNDRNALVNFIDRILANPDKRKRMGAAGRRIFKERFSTAAVSDKMANILSSFN